MATQQHQTTRSGAANHADQATPAVAPASAKPSAAEVNAAMRYLHDYIGPEQHHVLVDLCNGEESDHFKKEMVALADRIRAMPKTYEQAGRPAVAYLHYFKGAADWYVTEKDAGDAADPHPNMQKQWFGLADLYGDGGELGYIDTKGLLRSGVEIDLHFEPIALDDLRAQRERNPSATPAPAPSMR